MEFNKYKEQSAKISNEVAILQKIKKRGGTIWGI